MVLVKVFLLTYETNGDGVVSYGMSIQKKKKDKLPGIIFVKVVIKYWIQCKSF